MRQDLPARRAVSVVGNIINDGRVRGSRVVEISNDGQNWRMTLLFRNEQGKGRHGVVNEMIANTNQVLQASITGTLENPADQMSFVPNKRVSSSPVLFPGNFISNGGSLGVMSLVFGYVADQRSLVDIHSKSFSDSVDLLQIKDGAGLVHRESEIEFIFSAQRKLKTIRIPKYMVGTESIARVGTTIVKPIYNQEVSDSGLTKFQVGDEFKPDFVVQNFEVTQLPDSANLKTFIYCAVKNGDVVGRLGETTSDHKMLYYKNGRAGYAVDPKAEQEINLVLDRTNPDREKIQQLAAPSESLERFSYLRSATSTDCGLYSLAIASAELGVELPLESILSNEDYASGKGSSIAQLKRAIRENELRSMAIRFGNLDHLIAANVPAVVHCGNSTQASGVSHWVAVLKVDADNRKVLWADLPHEPTWISEAELMTTWDGTAVLVSEQAFGTLSSWKIRWQQLWMPAMIAILLLAGLLFARRFLPRITGSKSKMGPTGPLAVIFGFSLLLTIGWAVLSTLSYFKHPDAISLVDGKVPVAGFVETLEIPEHWSLEVLNIDSQTLVVDARIPRDFKRAHFEGAINLPTDCSLVELTSAWKRAKTAKKCLVYCQSEKCLYSHQVAKKLKLMGHENVEIFRPGFLKMPDDFIDFGQP